MDCQVIDLALRSLEALRNRAPDQNATGHSQPGNASRSTSAPNRAELFSDDLEMDSSAEIETPSDTQTAAEAESAADGDATQSDRSLAALGWDENSAEAEGADYGAGDEDYESEDLDEADEGLGAAASFSTTTAQCGEDLSRLDAQEVGVSDLEGEERLLLPAIGFLDIFTFIFFYVFLL